MILLHPYNPSPRTIWIILHRVARNNRKQFYPIRKDEMRTATDYFQRVYNIDSDYLMETLGKYALSIT